MPPFRSATCCNASRPAPISSELTDRFHCTSVLGIDARLGGAVGVGLTVIVGEGVGGTVVNTGIGVDGWDGARVGVGRDVHATTRTSAERAAAMRADTLASVQRKAVTSRRQGRRES